MSEKRKVAVVDDDEINRLILRKMLQRFDFEVHELASGEELLSLVAPDKTLPFQAVFIDISLNGLSGFEVATILKETLSSLPPIIAVTGYNKLEMQRPAKQAGICEVLQKPVSLDNLSEILEVHLPD